MGNSGSSKGREMKKLALISVLAAVMAVWGALPALAGGGFDEYGYNPTARNFVGAADGVDRNLDGTVWGDPTYANDHLR
jgi:hypothetical protein